MIKSLKDSIFLCLKICAFDDFLSEAELEELFKLFSQRNGITKDQFDEFVDEFFEASTELEALVMSASPLQDELLLAEQAAGADGLDARENHALQRCYLLKSQLADLERKDG